MRETRIIMAMPITIDVPRGKAESLEKAFVFLVEVDARFSTYKADSEISRINRGEILPGGYSPDMNEVFALAETAKQETKGFFNIQKPGGTLDPSGVVKGWAIQKVAQMLDAEGYDAYMVDGSGDIASAGKNSEGNDWSFGIQNPLAPEEIVKVVYPRGKGVATSGSMVRGAHIYNPLDPTASLDEVKSITVIGPDVLTADLYATAAFAMGQKGIEFLEATDGLEGYAIDKNGRATMTNGFPAYTTI